MVKAKPVKKDTMSKLVEFITKHQNDKKKLNAGQIREMIRLVVVGIGEGLEPVEAKIVIDEIKVTPFALKISKEKEIAHYEAKLKAVKETVV